MRSLRWPASVLSLLMSGSPAALASTIVHHLGVAPLLGRSSTTAEVRGKVRTHPLLMRRAASEIGLSPREYEAFYRQFMNQRPGWVTIPRRLNAMSWSSGGVVHAENDVLIPAGVQGWEGDLVEKHQIGHVYLPMICGILSVLRTPLNKVAAIPPPLPPRHIFTEVLPQSQPVVGALVTPDGFSQQIPPVLAPAAIVHHPHLFWPIFGTAVLVAVLVSHPHHGTTPSVATPPSAPVPPVPPALPVPPSVPKPPVDCVPPPPPPHCVPPPCVHVGQTWGASRSAHSGSVSVSL